MKKLEVSASTPELLKKEFVCTKIETLGIRFSNEDMNNVVDKINEIITNKCH